MRFTAPTLILIFGFILGPSAVLPACSSNSDPQDSGSNSDSGVTNTDATVREDARPGAEAGADSGVDPADSSDPLDADDGPDVHYNGDFERDPTRVTLNGACAQEDRFGGFNVLLNETVGYTAIDGVVRNGVIPNAVRDVTLEEGGCRLLKRRRLICDPPCGAGETCGLEETCIASPVGQDMGPVRLRGLNRDLDLSPQVPGNTYFYTRLTHPGVAEGSVVQLTVPMPQFFEPLELYGVGVRQLVPLDSQLVLTEGQPLTLSWEPPAPDSRSSVYMELNIDLHGLTPLLLTCDLPDTGTASVSAAMIHGLIGGGVTGYPEARVMRRTADSKSDANGCVEFVVSSVREMDIEVTGFIPCTGPGDCPPPLMCEVAIQQCR